MPNPRGTVAPAIATQKPPSRLAAGASAVLFGSLLLALLACRILGLVPLPSHNPILECSVSVRNPDAEAELGGEDVPEQNLSSRAEPFLADGVPLEHYALNSEEEGDCAPGQGFGSVPDAEADWRRLVRQRIAELEGDAESGSIFNRFPGGWCEVPGTVECVVTDEPEGECQTAAPTGGDPLPACPPSPPPPACLEVACDGTAPCSALDFGDVPTVARLAGQPPLGDGRRIAISITNCGGADAEDLVVRGLDGTVAPVGALFDFAIPPESNACHPANGDGEAVTLVPGASCEATVLFEPEDPGVHGARFQFSSNAQIELHEVALAGNGLGGGLVFAVGNLDPLPASLCFLGLEAGNCTAARTLEVTNSGPGAVTVEALQTVAADPNPNLFQISGPPPAPFAIADQATQTVDIAWCNATDVRDRVTLELRSNDPDRPSFLLDLEHRTAADAPCPPGS